MSMPYYAGWIAAETIPEPAAIGLMGFGTIGLFLARTKRRRKLVGRSLFPIRGDVPACDRFCAVEDGEVAEDGRICAGYLTQMRVIIHFDQLRTWVNRLRTRQKAYSNAFWRFFDSASERLAERKEAAMYRLHCVSVKRLDSLLEGISWDQMVSVYRRIRRRIRFFRGF
jgi:hypothetical protein